MVYKWRGPLIYLILLLVGARTALLLKESVGHAGHSEECGVPIWGFFFHNWENTHVFCGCVFGGYFLNLFFNNIFNLFHSNTILKCMFGCFCSTIIKYK